MTDKIIKCTHCNYEYILGEIFDPRYFLGQPKHIIRNVIGEILGYEGISMCNKESFICDNCKKEFWVESKVSVNVSKEEPKEEVEEIAPVQLF